MHCKIKLKARDTYEGRFYVGAGGSYRPDPHVTAATLLRTTFPGGYSSERADQVRGHPGNYDPNTTNAYFTFILTFLIILKLKIARIFDCQCIYGVLQKKNVLRKVRLSCFVRFRLRSVGH